MRAPPTSSPPDPALIPRPALPTRDGRSARTRVVSEPEPGCEFVRFATDDVLLGEFRAAPDFADFRSAGRIRNHVVAFPRTAVWIENEGERPFVADPLSATFYSPGRAYTRTAISAEGDETDWIGVSEPLAREIVARYAPRDAESGAAFVHRRAPASGAIYREQRRVFLRLRDGEIDPLEIEERTIGLVAETLHAAYLQEGIAIPPSPHRRSRGRDLAEEARELLAATVFENLSVRMLAERLAVSPFHLCRQFRARTGLTLHEHRREMRLRVALGLIPERRGALSALALDLGFHSHAHLTSAFRRSFGVPPTALTAFRDRSAS